MTSNTLNNVRTFHADGSVSDNLIGVASIALDMFTSFQYEVEHPEEARDVRGDQRVVRVMFVNP